jgi:hypothetical protein
VSRTTVNATTTTAPPSARDASFDAVKGLLVLLMVAYHVLSITTTAGVEGFRYLRFVSGSFIFLSGFVVVRFMWERFSRAPLETGIRLIGRGLKVLLIFTALNLAIHASGFGNPAKPALGVDGFVRQATAIYLAGDGRISSFLILLPIAYLLMLAPLYLAAAKRWPRAVPGALLAGCVAIGSGATEPSAVGEFLLVGACGLCLGTPRWARRVFAPSDRPAAVTLAALAVALWLAGRYGNPLVLYDVGVVVVLKLAIDAARLAPPSSAWFGQAVLLGRYSLMAYVAQIALIQLAFKASGSLRAEPAAPMTLAFALGTGVACWLGCLAMERLRHRAPLVDRAYRMVFA